MNKVSKKDYQLPLQEKITILGSRVNTSAQPNFTLQNNQLIITDNWVIQLVHTIPQKVTEPQLLEFPLTWEEIWPWEQEMPANITINYKKKPHIQIMHSLTTNHSQPVLNLTIETPLTIELTEQVMPAPTSNPTITYEKNEGPKEPPVEAQSQFINEHLTGQLATAKFQQSYQQLEENYLKLSQAMAELEQRLKLLEEKQAEEKPQVAKLTGYVVDSFRLIPVPKAILEFYHSSSETPLYKLAANNQGYFAHEGLLAGTYDIKVKHPRYLPLVMKSYPIASGESKYQDFLLKRM